MLSYKSQTIDLIALTMGRRDEILRLRSNRDWDFEMVRACSIRFSIRLSPVYESYESYIMHVTRNSMQDRLRAVVSTGCFHVMYRPVVFGVRPLEVKPASLQDFLIQGSISMYVLF
jgi:hypothetical protein